MIHVTAVYENGVLRPTRPLELREGQTVEVTVTDPPPVSDAEIDRRLREAKTYQEWFEATKLLPSDPGGFDVVKAIHQTRRETGFRVPAPESEEK